MSKQRMTKQNKNPFAAGITLLALLLFASCSQEIAPDTDITHSDEKVPLFVKNTTLEDGAATRATVAPPVGSSIGVFRQADSYYTTASNNVKYTLTTDKGWQPATAGTDILLGANDSRALLYAYHPAGKITVNADNVSVPLTNRAYDADYDLSYVAAGKAVALDVAGVVYNFHPGVTFAMSHAYTQLAVDLTRGDDYGGVGAITAVSLTVNGGGKLYSSGTQNIATGVYTPGTADVSKITYTVPADTKVTTANKTATFAQLLPPGKDGTISNLTLTVTVDGETTNTTISTTGLDLAAGTRYVVKATLNYSGLAATIKTTDWDSQTAWKEDVTFVPIISSIDIGLDFVIAPGNVVATSDGTGGYTYQFAEDQGYCSGTSAGGDYFRWNTLDPTATVTSNTTHVWDVNNDPCRKIEGGWRTPTEKDLNALEHGTPSENLSLQVWGIYRTRSGKEVNGFYFGTTTAPTTKKDQDKYVFLPAAGWYSENNVWQDGDPGTWGMYWSATSNSASDAIRLLFYDWGTNVGSNLWYTAYYNYGVSVRCVKDKPKPKPEHAIEIEGLDFYVADGNVVATLQDDKKTYTYAFAEDQGYYANDDSYFCWNTLVPGPPNIVQTSWDDARDPCGQIGDGKWYTPSKDQLQKLADLYNNGQVLWGTYTRLNKEEVEGMYFGTTMAPDKANQDKFVFLPTAGIYYADSNSYTNKGANGNYLSSTTSNDKVCSGGVNSGLSHDFIINYYSHNRDCMSLRCVRAK